MTYDAYSLYRRIRSRVSTASVSIVSTATLPTVRVNGLTISMERSSAGISYRLSTYHPRLGYLEARFSEYGGLTYMSGPSLGSLSTSERLSLEDSLRRKLRGLGVLSS